MPPKSSSDSLSYKKKIKLDLDKLKNGDIQKVKVDLSKFNVKKLAKRVGVLSEEVKLFMYLPTAKRYYALNDRTINLLMKGNVDMGSTTGGSSSSGHAISISDAEVVSIAHREKAVEMFIVTKNKTRSGGSFFPYLNITIFDLSKYGIFKTVDRHNYKHNCLYLALESGGLSVFKLQGLIFLNSI